MLELIECLAFVMLALVIYVLKVKGILKDADCGPTEGNALNRFTQHPSDDRLELYCFDRPEEGTALVEEHILSCPACADKARKAAPPGHPNRPVGDTSKPAS
jgi:hypothetical protein